MRLTSLFQAHPFTISWWEGPSIAHTAHRPLDDDALKDMEIIGRDTEQEAPDISRKGDLSIWLVVQSQWGLNKDLSEVASNTNIRAIVDGPYGSHSSLERFGHVVLFTQGAGITAQISYIKELFYGSLAGRLPVRRISLIWETQEEDLVIVQPWMKAILTEDHDHHKNTMMLHVQLYLVNQTASLRYGRRVRSFPGSVDLGSVLNREIKKQCGAMLVTVSASGTFVESLRGHLLNNINRGNLKEIELRCLDSQPQGAPQLARENTVERLVTTLSIINGEIHDYNVEHNMDQKLGIIDIGVFFYAWDERASDVHLEHFCRLQHYPVDWACRPPVPGADYYPYVPDYWKRCDWKTPEVLLGAVWHLRLGGTPDETVEDVEDTLRIFESKFNREVNRLHRRHENPSPWLNVGHLRVGCLLDMYRELATLISIGDPGSYARCRENFRRECMLSGYPESWVPGWYEEEKPTSPMAITPCESVMSI
ncbi:NADPH oxidase family protein [Aspergillus affinis]|uniref:NADPH oxidase family protein n=1 Tax=Aspergillus affinis TaxID=1070780 RepID=UPI0022FE1DC3|nr:uncharacterized protein KD926_002083 [Aspergillus affinis]KAI9036319.1 hypothetical protein KD926_002083 [Aspergillus affinis]